MHWIFTILFFMHSVFAGQQSLYGESCRDDVDCLNHLSCMDGICNYLDNVPSTKNCSSAGAEFTVRRGERLTIAFQCPPDCAFEDHTIKGPICKPTPEGCERSEDCKTYGLCGFKNEECVISAEGCSNSKLCSLFCAFIEIVTSKPLIFSTLSKLTSGNIICSLIPKV